MGFAYDKVGVLYSGKLGNRSEARASDLRSHPGLWWNRIKVRLYKGKQSGYSPRTFSIGRPGGDTLCPQPITLQIASSAGQNKKRSVAIERCKPCANPHDSGEMPIYLPVGLTRYVLNKFSKKSPPYHVTQDDVSTPLQRLEVEQIAGHQSVRGRGGVIAVIYKTHWAGLTTKLFPPSRGCRCCHLPSRVFVVSSSNPPQCR